MPKKAKDLNRDPTSDSGPRSIFDTLLGDVAVPSDSIFSTNNPYRRKPADCSQAPQQEESGQGTGSFGNNVSNRPADAEFSGSNADKPERKTKKKRDREMNGKIGLGSAGESSEMSLHTKKLKGFESEVEYGSRNMSKKGKEEMNGGKGRKENLNLGVESTGIVEDHNLGSESVVLEDGRKEQQKEQKKKKRKRDDLEAEYEARRYGVGEEERAQGGLAGLKVGEKRKKLDNPEDTLVPKEGFDDEHKLLRTVFVGNLPLKVKKKSLIKEFSKFGEVESVRIRSVPILDTKRPRKSAIIKKQINDSAASVHAYVVYRTEECAQAALAHNMYLIGGQHIRVDRACPPRKKLKGDDASLYDKQRTVFVGNLPFDVKDEEIYQTLSGINNLESSIEAIRVIRDPNTSLGKGIAYVLFKTQDAASKLIKRHSLKVRDRELRFHRTKDNSTPSKRKASAAGLPPKRLESGVTTPNSSKDGTKSKAALSYQGLRAGKSRTPKKTTHRNYMVQDKSASRSPKLGDKLKGGKRPAVAARKAKTKMLQATGGSKQVGKKRKGEGRTPDGSRKNKKVKRY